MRYVIYGVGGIGGVIGARLMQHGREVVLVARERAAPASLPLAELREMIASEPD